MTAMSNDLEGEIIGAVIGGGVLVVMAYLWLQQRRTRPNANQVAAVLGATVETHPGGMNDTTGYHVIGERAGREVKLVFGGFDDGKIEVKLGSLTGDLSLRYDPKAKAKAHAENQLDADHSNGMEKQKYFLSRHVYLEDHPPGLRKATTIWNQLPGELTRAMIQQMEARTIERAGVDGTTVTLRVKYLGLKRRGVALALQMLDLAGALATAMEAQGPPNPRAKPAPLPAGIPDLVVR